VLGVAAAAAAALVACNAILGVTEVTLRDGEPEDVKKDGGEPSDPKDSGLPLEDAEAPPPEQKPWFGLGFLHGCARLAGGEVRCWGDNFYGQLGDGLPFDAGTRLESSNRPVPVPGIDDAVSIGAGNSHTCVVRSTGQVLCWGNNNAGQLGNGTKDKTSKPTPVIGVDDAVQVVAGVAFTCALRRDRTVACWGANGSGQLGDDTKEDRPMAAQVKQLSDVASLAAGRDHACAALVNGDVMCWGDNADGQLGIGSTTDAPLPTKLSGLSDIVQVAGAARFSCARERSGRVYCWGSNAEGQLGNGSPNPAPNPSPILVPSLGDAIWIWAGFEHACAVKKNGSVVCWGRGAEGQLGIGLQPDGSVRTPVPTPTPVVGVPESGSVYTGGDRSCALSTDGRGFCWGSNSFGQLANGNNARQFSASPMVDFP
jgi:alpha-tubulin suppressor-like RCC1 family protein